jgi:hypothetical protein
MIKAKVAWVLLAKRSTEERGDIGFEIRMAMNNPAAAKDVAVTSANELCARHVQWTW